MLTPVENTILQTLSSAYNQYRNLSTQKETDIIDFSRAIRSAEQIVMARDTRRSNPDVFQLSQQDDTTEIHNEVTAHVYTV